MSPSGLSPADQAYYDSLPVKGGRLNNTGRNVGGFSKVLEAPKKLDPDYMWQFFPPSKFGVRLLEGEWRERVKEIDERLEVAWHPVRERWVVWVRDESVANPYVRGWKLIFPWSNPYDDSFLPVDERLLANIWARSSRKVSGREYWDRIESEVWRDKQKKEQARQQQVRDEAADYFDWRQIKVSMCGPSNGSKFSDSHSE